MTPEQLSAIEARANAASPGPWKWDDEPTDACCWSYHVESVDRDGAFPQLNVEKYAIADMAEKGDAEFLAAARTDVPALVAEVRRLDAAVREAEEVLRDIEHPNWMVADQHLVILAAAMDWLSRHGKAGG